MEGLRNAIRSEAARQASTVEKTRYGLVDDYDPSAYSVKVRLQPENKVTGWIPLASIRVGNGAGIYTPPNVGDQVVIDFQEGDIENGLVRAAVYSDIDKPLSVPAGEIWIVMESGVSFKMTNDGIVLQAGSATFSFTSAGFVQTGGVQTHNNVNVGSNHRHGQVQTGSGQTGLPLL